MNHTYHASFHSLGWTLAVLCLTGCQSDSRPVKAPPPAAPASASNSGAGAGTTTTPPARSAAAEAVGSSKLRSDLLESKTDINGALGSLSEITNPATADLNAPFNRYSDALARLQQRSDTMKREANTMRQSQSAYFAGWEEKVSDIDNPTIRASAEARRSRLRAAQERLTTKSGAVRDAYEPFMRDLQDVRKFLAGDLTKQSAALVADAAKKTQESGAVVNQRIDDLVAEIDSIDASTTGGGAGGTGATGGNKPTGG